MWIFFGAILVVAVLGYFKELRPAFEKSAPAQVVEIVSADKAVKTFNVKDGKIVALAKDGTLVLDVKDSKSESSKRPITTLRFITIKVKSLKQLPLKINSVVITAGDKN